MKALLWSIPAPQPLQPLLLAHMAHSQVRYPLVNLCSTGGQAGSKLPPNPWLRLNSKVAQSGTMQRYWRRWVSSECIMRVGGSKNVLTKCTDGKEMGRKCLKASSSHCLKTLQIVRILLAVSLNKVQLLIFGCHCIHTMSSPTSRVFAALSQVCFRRMHGVLSASDRGPIGGLSPWACLTVRPDTFVLRICMTDLTTTATRASMHQWATAGRKPKRNWCISWVK